VHLGQLGDGSHPAPQQPGVAHEPGLDAADDERVEQGAEVPARRARSTASAACAADRSSAPSPASSRARKVWAMLPPETTKLPAS
jgi:hypothetical protein